MAIHTIDSHADARLEHRGKEWRKLINARGHCVPSRDVVSLTREAQAARELYAEAVGAIEPDADADLARNLRAVLELARAWMPARPSAQELRTLKRAEGVLA